MRYFIILLALMTSLTTQAQKKSGVHVGNGGGFSEYNLQIAYQSYGEWLRHLQSYDKSIQGDELILLNRLASSSLLEIGGLVFNTDYNELTHSNTQVGSAVYVNSKLLQQFTDHLNRDLLLSEAYSLILKQIGQRVVDAQNKSLLALVKRIEAATSQSILASTAVYKDLDLMKSYSWSDLSNRGQLIVSSPNSSAINLSELVQGESDCDDQDLVSLKILEPAFIVSAQGNDDFAVQMNFYIKVTCGESRYVKDVSTRLFINAKQFKFLSIESRISF